MTDYPFLNSMLLFGINFVAVTLIVTVFVHERLKDRQSQIFVLMGIMMLVWVDFAYFARWVGAENQYISELFLRIAWVATPPLFYLTFLISTYLVKAAMKQKWLNLGLFVLTIAVSALAAFTNIIISGVNFERGSLDVVYGAGFYPFLGVIFLYMILTLVPMVRAKLTKSVRAFLVGVVIFYVLNMVFNIGLPLVWGITHLYYLGDYSTVFLLGFTMYAILRHGLFDIKVVATEILTIVIWSVLLSKVFLNTSLIEGMLDIGVFVVTVIFGIFLIRSVVKEVEQRRELERLARKLKQLDKTKDEFISVAAHELRAPLTAVRGYSSMMLEGDTGPVSAKAKEYLLDTQISVARMIRLVNNMLDVGRIEEGRIVYQEDYYDIGEIVEQAFGEFRLEAERKKLKYVFEEPKGVQAKVYLDRDRLHEVVVNFLSNALKYTDKGSVVVKVSNPEPGQVKVEVVDSGRGISKKEQKKLFSKFYRVESNTGKTIGSGLGLYISKLLIKQFRGQIGVDSKPGRGSIFWFVLPSLENDDSLDKKK